MVGDGPLRDEIVQKAKELQVEDEVIFLGIRSDINRLLQAFDLFVFPSLHEGLPVSLIEAQGSGLPCIISDQISKEVDLDMDLIDYASLGDLQSWIDKIEKRALNLPKRYIRPSLLVEKGYDIKETAKEIDLFLFKGLEVR